MRWYYKAPLRLRSLFRSRKADLDLSEELQFHLQNQIDEYVAQGMDRQEARRAAFQSLGGVERVKEECREARKMNLIGNFVQDVRFGLRMLRRSPGFTVLAILCLTLGIGANAAVFSWVEGVLLRPYPLVAHQERLVAISGTLPDKGDYGDLASWPDLLDLARSCTQCEAVFVSKINGATLSIGERAEVTTGSIVSANYFDAIGVHPILGRGFEPDEDIGRNAHAVVVISYHLWQTRFQGDPKIIGKTQRLNNVAHTIIGVTPEGFYGTFVGRGMKFWVPVSMLETFDTRGDTLEDRGARWAEAYVRLKPGVTRNQAQQEISAIAARLAAEYPATNRGRGIKIWPLWQTPFNHAGHLLPTLEIMVVVVMFVLLIVCANVGNLLLVRSFARRHEMTVRLAMGAGRGRLVRQLVTEGLVLSACGGAGGIVMAYWCRHALALFFPGDLLYLPGEIDGRVLGLSAAICLIVTLAVGLVPVFQTRHLALADTLKTEASAVMGARGRAWLRSSLVVLQVTLSFILLVGATLLLQSLRKIRTTNPGFSTTQVLDTWIPLVAAGYDAPRARNFQDELMQRVRALPGVEAAAYARIVPLGYQSYSSAPIAVDGYVPQPNEEPTVEYNEVSPDYFATMGIPLISGREFMRADDENAPRVAIVNQTMVARYWRGRSPIGERLQVKGDWVQVVGVAADSKYSSLSENAEPFFYVPLRQYFDIQPDIHIRTTQAVESVQRAMIREVRTLDANLALAEMTTLEEQVNRSTSHQIVAVTLVALFGGLALLLAGIGLYGVMSYTVSQSTRELGLRMALGAGASNVLRLMLSRGLLLTTTGIVIGIALALLLTRLLGNLLYQVSPRDPLAFGSAFVVMLAAALAACFLPAWRATRTDPMRALRAE